MTTRVRVAVRCRPLVEKEIQEGCEGCVTVIDDSQVLLGKDKYFTYDYAFGNNTCQEEIFQNCGYPLVEAIFKGFNATMLAYGQTGSGKTYTMGSGKIGTDTDEAHLGIIPRVVELLFQTMDERADRFSYVTTVSFLEIYNEEIKDLLSSSSENGPLPIREDGQSVKITGLTEKEVTAPTDTLNLLCQGSDHRAVGSTRMNETSSRSHAIFTLTIQQQSKQQTEDSWCAKFHLVDLAGSERIKKTGAEGDRRKEGININLGLLALGNVVSALGEEKKKKNTSHIPYRDSKLTRLLQDSLGGNSCTLMIACVSPADSNMEETLNTLRYADRAKKIKNKPIVNRDPHVAEILQLKAVIAQLQSDAVSGQLTGDAVSSLEFKKLKERSDLLEMQNEKLTSELTNAIDHSNDLCEKVIVLEMSHDKLKSRLHKITVDTGISLEELDNSLKDSELKADLRERLEHVKAIQQEICDLDRDKATLECTISDLHDRSLITITELSEDVTASTEQTSTSTLTPENGDQQAQASEGDSFDTFAKTYTLHRAKMSRQLKELNDMLSEKEELIKDSVSVEQKRESLKHHQVLEKKIKDLEEEKGKLMQQLGGSKTAALGKISEQRRQRLKELEQQMTELKRKLKEQGRIVKMKEQTDKQLEKLNKEIVSMKQQRVRLLKQIKEESEKFRKWKLEQDKKMLQLKAKDRKRECDMAKMEMQHSKSQAFYKRKAEEAALANKRLKDALQRQKSSRERHSIKQEKDTSSIGPRVRALVNDEVEMMVSVREAERLLQDQQAHRADLNQHLKSLRSSHPEDDSQAKVYQTQLSLCSAAISELNQKLQDAKGTKTQTLSERLTSMVEARCAIRHLVSLVVKDRLNILSTESQIQDTSSAAENSERRLAQLEKELHEMEDYHYNEIQVLTQNFERKMAAMKREMEKRGGNISDLNINSMQLDVTSLHDELEEKNRKIDELERKIGEMSRTPTNTVVSFTPKSGVLGERFPNLSKGSSPYMDKVTVSAKHPPLTKVKVNTKASREENKLTVVSKLKMLPEDESFIISDESDVENDDPADLSWHATPEVRRMKRMSSFTKCGCTTQCRSLKCGCKAKNVACGPMCKCKDTGCKNTRKSTNGDVSSEDFSTNTSSILNTTFEVNKSSSETNTSHADKDGVPGKRRKLIKEGGLYMGSPV